MLALQILGRQHHRNFFFQNYLENPFLYVFGVSKHDYGIIFEFRVQFTPLIIKKILYFFLFKNLTSLFLNKLAPKLLIFLDSISVDILSFIKLYSFKEIVIPKDYMYFY